MQKIFEKLRIEILKTLDDQNAGYAESTNFFVNKSAKNSNIKNARQLLSGANFGWKSARNSRA